MKHEAHDNAACILSYWLRLWLAARVRRAKADDWQTIVRIRALRNETRDRALEAIYETLPANERLAEERDTQAEYWRDYREDR